MKQRKARTTRLVTSLALALFLTFPASAMSEQTLGSPATVLITLGTHAKAVEVLARLEVLLDEGTRVALTGSSDALARVRPSFAHAWPAANTVVLDPGVTLGITGFDATDEDHREAVLRGWSWSDDVLPSDAGPSRRDIGERRRNEQHVEFNVLATSPAAVCEVFSRNMAAALFGATRPTAAMRRAFRREVRRWCQYGTLSAHAAEPAQFVIEPFEGSDDMVLSLGAEWALVRNEPVGDPANTTYLFWARTMGEGAGTGFTRRHGSDGWYDAGSKAMRNLLDVAIHSGWGPIEGRDVVTAWPLNSSFPHVGNVHVFRCDAPNAFRPYECPFAPMLRKLYPDDSHDGLVTVSAGENLSVSGDAGFTRTVGSEGAAVHFTLGMTVGRQVVSTTQVASSLMDVRSNADTLSYRSTWWRPDIPAIQQWIDARKHAGSLVKATALASTLNPRHEIIWELPLGGNRGRELPYHVVYEAGWNTCINGTHCKDHGRYPMPELPPKARVGWSDGIVLKLPAGVSPGQSPD